MNKYNMLAQKQPAPDCSYLLTVLIICLAAAVSEAQEQLVSPVSYQNPSHVPLRDSIRRALEPGRTEALEEAVEAAITESGGSRQVERLLSLSYPDFGGLAKVQAFNRLRSNSTEKFLPLLLGLLGVDARHLADVRELAFPPLPDIGADNDTDWRVYKLLHWPKGERKSGSKLSCLLVTPVGSSSYDVVLVISSTAAVEIGDRDLLVAETKLAEQLGWPDRREGRLIRVGHEAGLSDTDLDGAMAFAELNCLRKLGAHFEVAMDN